MSDTNRPGGPGAGAAVVADRSVLLVRYRSGVTGEAARTVHLVSLRDGCEAGMVGTLCGTLLSPELIEAVIPGQGMPCGSCIRYYVSVTDPVAEQAPAGLADGVTYAAWNWPITQHCDHIRLDLHREASAIAVPIPLGTELIQVLTARYCAPAVLAHPDFPEHHIVLVGERYGVPLPWPSDAHPVTGALLLPPTMTPRGPITWIQPPREDSLRLSREIDVFGALRAVLGRQIDHRIAKASAPPMHARPSTIQVM
ncbi:MAG: hypothetical protein WCB57_18335 [Pseudonocardiaceae bacterium]